jgi:acetyltransferase-like isoleucine patch superfamily enzyme
MRLIKKICKLIPSLWWFVCGNIFALFIYDSKYLRGKYFRNKYFGVGAIGWKWVCINFPFQFFFRINSHVPWPVSPRVLIDNPDSILFHPDDINNFQTAGNYFSAIHGAKIIIGHGTWIAPNVGFITSNHDLNNPDINLPGKDIILGEKCWIGMNVMILPGVTLGPHTVVGAGAVVTKSFPEGYCVIAGNPAKVLKRINDGNGSSNKSDTALK